jgi:hypothetical protein
MRRLRGPRLSAGVVLAVGLLVLAASCGTGSGEPEPSASTRTSARPTPSVSPTPPPVVTTPPETTPAATSPSPSAAAPDPRSVDVHSLLRPGTRVMKVIYGDVDGDGVDDIVLASAVAHPPPGAVMAQPYLDVYRYDGTGWPKAWEATEPAPPGNPNSPASVLAEPDPSSVSQQIDFLGLIDMAHDGSVELVVGILNVGAGPGPLDVWVVGFGPEGAVNDFSESTTSGGVLVAAGDELRLQTPAFRSGDPACCPSRIEHQTIGFDSAAGKVRVLHQTFTPVS